LSISCLIYMNYFIINLLFYAFLQVYFLVQLSHLIFEHLYDPSILFTFLMNFWFIKSLQINDFRVKQALDLLLFVQLCIDQLFHTWIFLLKILDNVFIGFCDVFSPLGIHSLDILLINLIKSSLVLIMLQFLV